MMRTANKGISNGWVWIIHQCCPLLIGLMWSAPGIAADDEVTLLKTIQIPGNLIDKSGRQELLGPEIWHDLFGGISALEYLGHDDLYLALPDRGPLDGAVDWTCRFQFLQLTLDLESRHPDFRVVETKLLNDGERRFSGLAEQYCECETTTKRCDPEGIRADKNGRIFLSDEYGPQLFEFDSNGNLVKEHSLPNRYQIANPRATKQEENAANDSGRQSNRGLEGLALSPDGTKLYGLMQSPLLQDSETTASGKPTGLNCRMLELDIETGSTREFLYVLDDPKNKLNEILAINNHEFLVIERDGNIGRDAKYKKIIKVSLRKATDIQEIDNLPAMSLPPSVTPVTKQVFIDLLDSQHGLSGDSMPEKIEGLTFGPDFRDGRQTLLVASDNDFKTNQPTLVYCFAIGKPNTKKLTHKIDNKLNY